MNSRGAIECRLNKMGEKLTLEQSLVQRFILIEFPIGNGAPTAPVYVFVPCADDDDNDDDENGDNYIITVSSIIIIYNEYYASYTTVCFNAYSVTYSYIIQYTETDIVVLLHFCETIRINRD